MNLIGILLIDAFDFEFQCLFDPCLDSQPQILPSIMKLQPFRCRSPYLVCLLGSLSLSSPPVFSEEVRTGEPEAVVANQTQQSMSDQEAVQAMDAAKEEIEERLDITAPLELDLQNGVDPVIVAAEEGMIVEATIEQVEAALAAAAATPEPEDDIEAIILKCRGSYRFFLDPSTVPTPEPPEGEPDADVVEPTAGDPQPVDPSSPSEESSEP